MNKPTLIAMSLAAALSAGQALAHDSDHNDCNVELDGKVQYYKGLLTVEMNNGSTMTITPDHVLSVNGEEMSLSREQQDWVNDYYDHIDAAIPMTLQIAHEGLDIASVAVTEAFGELLGHDDDTVAEFRDMFADVSESMNTKFYDASGNVKIDSANFSDDGWFDEAWEDEFEDKIESLVTQSMGRILVSVGTEMMFSGGDMEEFEQRMENFGASIESRVEKQAEALEVKADALCQVLAKADYAENKMQETIPGLDGLNVLSVDGNALKM